MKLTRKQADALGLRSTEWVLPMDDLRNLISAMYFNWEDAPVQVYLRRQHMATLKDLAVKVGFDDLTELS